MEKTITNKNFVFWALIASIICITIISIMPVMKNGSDQKALALASKNNSSETKAISGRYMIGVTISEDFLKEGSEKIKQEIFIDGKRYEFTADNIATEIKSGFYDVRGTLNTKTNKVALTSATFAGEIFDGARDAKGIQTPSSKKSKKVAVFLLDSQNTATQPFYPSNVTDIMFGTGKFKQYFQEASYGRQSITGDVFGWFSMPGNGTCNPDPTNDLGPLIAGSPIDLNNYTNILIITLCAGNTSYGMSNTVPSHTL